MIFNKWKVYIGKCVGVFYIVYICWVGVIVLRRGEFEDGEKR